MTEQQDLIDFGVANGWESTPASPYRTTLSKDGKDIDIQIVTPQITHDTEDRVVTLIYFFGDGRHFAIAAGDVIADDLTLVEIGKKWISGQEPDTRKMVP